MDTWIVPDIVGTDHGDSGSEVLWDLGIFDIADTVRVILIDRINHAAQTPALGPAVDLVARAWWDYRRTTRYSDSPRYSRQHEQATARMIAARAAYTRLRRDVTASRAATSFAHGGGVVW
ncbi:hypothetical protein [Nocardia sp. GP40]|uniref:hypothetical protein n=1 Tax=Nocardia sp. GP40 TaxID=3156268 RepID=UPI003D229E95